jgi:hypothetical protein
MKINNKLIVKIVAIFLITIMMVTFTHCVPQVAKEVGNGGGAASSNFTPSPAVKSEGQILNETQVAVGVKDFEQIYSTMSALTGIVPDITIKRVYDQVNTSLPTTNDIKVYTSTQQVAVTKLAVEFCFYLTLNANSAQRSRIWPSLNLNAVSGTAFNAANEEAFINQTISAFWGDILSEDERRYAHDEFRMLIEQIINNENTVQATQRTVRGVCTAALSSAYVTFL